MKLEDVTEREWQTQVIQLLRAMNYRLAHFRPGKTARGKWATPMSGDVGYPDITAVGRGRIAFLELKTEKGKVAPEQADWLEALGAVPGIIAGVFRPSDLDELARVLR